MTPGLFPRKMSLIITDEGGEAIDLAGLSTKFRVVNDAAGAIGYSRISVFNLSETTISKLRARKTRIRLDAGYPQRFGTIFDGEVRNVFPTRDGADKIVEIFAAENSSSYGNSKFIGSFPDGSSLERVVGVVAATFEGVNIGSLEFLAGKFIIGAVSFAHPTKFVMDQLAKSHGFNWSIRGNTLQVVDKGPLGGQATLEVSRDSGMIDSPLASTDGVEVLTLLDHRIVPDRVIDVISAGAQLAASDSALRAPDIRVTGREFRQFRVTRLVHLGESRGQTWYTQAFAVPNFEALV